MKERRNHVQQENDKVGKKEESFCTNLKIITYTCFCIAFSMYTMDLIVEKRVKKNQLYKYLFKEKENPKELCVLHRLWAKWKGTPKEVVNVLGHS